MKNFRATKTLYLFVIPGLVYYALFKYWPIYGLHSGITLHSWDLRKARGWDLKISRDFSGLRIFS